MTDTTTINLRPCPFCGGAAVFERMGTRRQSCIVACTNCGARLDTDEEGAACGTAWNTRTTDDAMAALRDTRPALILLGNYIGNEWKGGGGIDAFDRCALIAAVNTALDKQED